MDETNGKLDPDPAIMPLFGTAEEEGIDMAYRGSGLAGGIALLMATAATATELVTVDLTFSDKALAELLRRGEGVVVAAYWSGEAVPGATMVDPELGTVFLMSEELTLHPATTRLVLGGNLAAAPLEQVIEPRLNLNVYSGRWTDENNLLDCGFLDDAVAMLTAKPQVVLCKLIGE